MPTMDPKARWVWFMLSLTSLLPPRPLSAGEPSNPEPPKPVIEGKKEDPAEISQWRGTLRAKPAKGAAEEVYAILVITSSEPGIKEKTIPLLTMGKMSPKTMENHVADKIKDQCEVIVTGKQTPGGIEVSELIRANNEVVGEKAGAIGKSTIFGKLISPSTRGKDSLILAELLPNPDPKDPKDTEEPKKPTKKPNPIPISASTDKFRRMWVPAVAMLIQKQMQVGVIGHHAGAVFVVEEFVFEKTVPMK